MLRYACHLAANMRPITPLRLSLPSPPEGDADRSGSGEDLAGLLGGRAVVCLAFDDMQMVVHRPQAVTVGVPEGRRGPDVWGVEEPGSVPTLVGSGA